jgi:hypothetical protein
MVSSCAVHLMNDPRCTGAAGPSPLGLAALPPTVVIRLPLEGSPSLQLTGCGPGDAERMLVWLAANPRQLAVVAEAIELSEAEVLRRR